MPAAAETPANVDTVHDPITAQPRKNSWAKMQDKVMGRFG